MIVITDKPGQLCNRLWAYSPFIAHCLKYNRRLIILNFENYHNHFEDLNRYSNIKIGWFKNNRTHRIFLRLIKIVQKLKLDKISSRIQFHTNSDQNTNEFRKDVYDQKSLLFTSSWMKFPDEEIMAEYIPQLKKIFTPEETAVNTVENLFGEKRKTNTAIVGIHLRKGDYKNFMNGKYYFSDEIYLEVMTDLQNQINKETGKETTFFLSSDSPVNTDNFDSLNTFQINNSSAIKDLYALSRCDYITGPPSTFSMWASYYGDVPLRFLKTKKDLIKLSDFSPIIAQNKFKNGHIFSHDT